MARSIWSGSVSMGLVNVPVKLYSATSPKSVKFNQLSAKTGARIQQKRFDSSTDKEIEFADIVKGYELSPGRYVTVTPEELEAIAPKKTKMLAIERFVDVGEIDPMAYDTHYYFGPGDETGGTVKAYRLLADAMGQNGKVGIGRLVLRTKESLAALRVNDQGILMVSTLLFADELLAADRQVDLPSVMVEPTEAEVKMAGMLIGAMCVPWDHAEFRDEYRTQVLELIEAKGAGETIEAPTDDVPTAPAPDLMAALQASLEAAGGVAAAGEVPAAAKPKRKSKTTQEVPA